ncbi:cytochrome C [Steroidobacter denitrificans]|uniref:Cytochrome C n=1 Tax=Steroidobacter denitrificans TaxID=465721 RepID=A0A127FDE8_STEDE|nr:c-type cytochrome [Steroidobacter denitrificans]AMN47750.1 cytochrome C [Steroidobacter denitrificans]
MPTRLLKWLFGSLASLILAVAAGAQTPTDPGRVLFEQLCVACHSIGEGDRVGPDLAGVTQRRDEAWIGRMIREPDAMIAAGDPVVTALVKRFNGIIMPRLGLDEAQAEALVAHLRALDAGAAMTTPALVYDTPELMPSQALVWRMFLLIGALIALVFAAVAFSTNRPREVSIARAYGLRRALFLAALAAAIGILATTLPKTPYAAHGSAAVADVDRIIYVAGRQFEFIWSDEPIVSAADIGRVPRLHQLTIDPGATVEFRVTSLDVNHGFGLYGPQRQIVAQTQAMPGYVNRLRVRLDEPGEYAVLCIEYCAAAHHRMRNSLIVR